MFKIIGTTDCQWCRKAKALLTALGYEYQEELLDTPEKKEAFKASGFATVPQIYRRGLLIGGYSDLVTTIKDRLAWT